MYNYINYRYYSVRFDPEKKSFDVFHEKYGKILSDLTLTAHMRDLNNVYSCVKLSEFKNITCTHEKHLDSNCLSVNFSEGAEQLPFITVRFNLDNKGVTFELDANKEKCYQYFIEGKAIWGDTPLQDTFSVSSKKQFAGIRSALGPASSPKNDALFNRINDSMLCFKTTSSPNLKFNWQENCYCFTVKFNGTDSRKFRIEIQDNVYADMYSLKYKCINKANTFPTPPAGFMTWYALMWDTSEKTLLDNVKIMAEKLGKYGADTVWVDWEWYHNDFFAKEEKCDIFSPDKEKYPHGLKYIADEIKKYNLIPAVWIAATNDVRENDYLKENNEILLFEKKFWCGHYFFDPTHPKFVKEFIPKVFKQLMNWGYEAIKWDALPLSIDFYDQYHDNLYDGTKTTEQILRDVVSAARKTVGENIYMLSCHGEASRDITFAADIFDAARIGADIFKWEEFLSYCVDRLFKYYPLHNVVQYTDPDNVVIREEMNNGEQAVSRVSFVSLLGTPYTIGDNLTLLADKRMELLRRTLPVCDIHPMDICSGESDKDIVIVNLAVSKQYEDYNILDFFNRTKRKVSVNKRFYEDLGMEDLSDGYLLYDFWNKTFLGIYRYDIDLELKPFQSTVVSARPNLGRPQLLSTNRHITQGAYEMKELKWDEENLILSGMSLVVADDLYEITIYVPEGYKTADEHIGKIEDNIYCLHLLENESKEINWSVSFIKA